MYLLYLDDSGSVKNSADRHVILAGIAVNQFVPPTLSDRLDRLAEKYWPENPSAIEFRGSAMWSGRSHWRGVERNARLEAIEETLDIARRTKDLRIFGAAIHKAALSPADPMEYAFEQLANRFDRFLLRLHRANKTDRGIIILDESTYETSLQKLAKEFGKSGHSWGRLRNIAEVPLFVDSKATRLIQMADLVAYSFRRYYENADARYFDIIKQKVDAVGGVSHGAVHYTPKGETCVCFACSSRSK